VCVCACLNSEGIPGDLSKKISYRLCFSDLQNFQLKVDL
jgi:hypothetical protein